MLGVLFYLFIVCSCVLVDIVPVSTELPVGVEQDQLFEEEEPEFLAEEGKWISPPIFPCFVLIICMSKFTLLLCCSA